MTAVDVQRAEPLTNYEYLEPKEIRDQFDKLSEHELVRVLNYEKARSKPRSAIVEDLENRLKVIEQSSNEGQQVGDPEEQKKRAKALDKRKPVKAPDEDDDVEQFGKGTIREAAEKASNEGAPDPVEPNINPEYVKDRDPVDAAQQGEATVASGPDDLGQRDAAAILEAEPLREEVRLSHRNLPEAGSTHEVSSQKADAGEQYPEDPDDPDELVEKRDKATAKAETEAENDAKKAAKELKGDAAVVADAREDAPTPPGDMDDPFVEDHPSSLPLGTALNVGDHVRRLDRSHDEIGVITGREPPIEAGLLKVKFPKAGEQLLNVNNLAPEGNPVHEEARARAYARSDLRNF